MIEQADLRQFIGTQNYYRHGLVRSLVYTDGVQYLAEQAGAYWLIDVVASYQHKPEVRAEEFQAWTLEHKPDDEAVVYMQRDEGEPHIVEQQIPYTDFPFESLGESFTLWLVLGGTGDGKPAWVLMLPSEY